MISRGFRWGPGIISREELWWVDRKAVIGRERYKENNGVHPNHSDRYIVVRWDAGDLRVEPG
jgi:hypothetical protein